MKYTIEANEYGCLETIVFNEGREYVKRTVKTDYGFKSEDDEFYEQMERDGICEEVLDRVCDLFDGFLASNFMDLLRLLNG